MRSRFSQPARQVQSSITAERGGQLTLPRTANTLVVNLTRVSPSYRAGAFHRSSNLQMHARSPLALALNRRHRSGSGLGGDHPGGILKAAAPLAPPASHVVVELPSHVRPPKVIVPARLDLPRVVHLRNSGAAAVRRAAMTAGVTMPQVWHERTWMDWCGTAPKVQGSPQPTRPPAARRRPAWQTWTPVQASCPSGRCP